MRQGCLVCDQWVQTGLGHAVVMRGEVTDNNKGRLIMAQEVEGLICSDCWTLDGNIGMKRKVQELQQQIAVLERQVEALKSNPAFTDGPVEIDERNLPVAIHLE